MTRFAQRSKVGRVESARWVDGPRHDVMHLSTDGTTCIAPWVVHDVSAPKHGPGVALQPVRLRIHAVLEWGIVLEGWPRSHLERPRLPLHRCVRAVMLGFVLLPASHPPIAIET